MIKLVSNQNVPVYLSIRDISTVRNASKVDPKPNLNITIIVLEALNADEVDMKLF